MTPVRFAAGTMFILTIALSGCGSANQPSEPQPEPYTHPLFQTPVSGVTHWRPAFQLDVLRDDRRIFFTAKFYLTVQSSRFPGDTRVILPVNIGDFAGCKTRFVQLPFEVRPDDKLLFNLLHIGEFTAEDEQRVLAGCRALGYCVLSGARLHNPVSTLVIAPGVHAAADILGDVLVQEFQAGTQTNYGTAEYVVPASLPPTPQQANRLTILEDGKAARAEIRLYGPLETVQFAP